VVITAYGRAKGLDPGKLRFILAGEYLSDRRTVGQCDLTDDDIVDAMNEQVGD
jgi:Ubiquitin-2 like Rad60 SUMO-like